MNPSGRIWRFTKPIPAATPTFTIRTGGLTDGSWSGDQPHTFASGELSAFPKTTTIDLGTVSNVSRVRIGVPTFGSTKTVRVSLSADGQTFSEVGSHTFSLASGGKHDFKFAPQNARYVRLTFPDHYDEQAGYASNFVFLSEAEVYGPTV